MKETLTMAQSLLTTIKEQGDLKILDTLQDEDLLDLQVRSSMMSKSLFSLWCYLARPTLTIVHPSV